MKVFVLAPSKTPMMPCSQARARLLLTAKEAAVFRRYPFTIILKRPPSDGVIVPLRFKADPGSKVTGIVVTRETKGKTPEVVFAAELTHRGNAIKNALDSRRGLRRSRRARHTRYRPARFDHRTRTEGWLAPSLMHRVLTTMTWFNRLRKLCPLSDISMECVSFDTQLMQNPEIKGVEYQQGELAGYEVRQYLLEKFGHRCAYCGKKDVPLDVEHIIPKSKGGSNRVSNLTIACKLCNQMKGNRDVSDFLKGKPDLLKKILVNAKAPLKDAAAANSTRPKLFNALKAIGLPVEVGTGGRTKFNRIRQGLPKEHWVDAACVGESGTNVVVPGGKPLRIKAMGHGSRRMCGTDKFGFRRRNKDGTLQAARERRKVYHGFQTGDVVVYKGGIGRISACCQRPRFNIGGKMVPLKKVVRRVHRQDGYAYA